MRRSHFTGERIVGILQEYTAGAKVADLCRRSRIRRGLQRTLVWWSHVRPLQARRAETIRRATHRTTRHAEMDRNPPNAPTTLQCVLENLPQLPHRQPRPCHLLPPGSVKTPSIGTQNENTTRPLLRCIPPPPQGGPHD